MGKLGDSERGGREMKSEIEEGDIVRVRFNSGDEYFPAEVLYTPPKAQGK